MPTRTNDSPSGANKLPAPKAVEFTDDAEPLVACLDAGGTKTMAVICDSKGRTFTGLAGSSNCSTIGIEKATEVVKLALSKALFESGHLKLAHEDQEKSHSSSALGFWFKAIWIGSAGVSTPKIASRYKASLESALIEYGLVPWGDSLPASSTTSLWVSNDAVLLASPMLMDERVQSTVCLVAGTGSAGFGFRKISSRSQDAKEGEGERRGREEGEEVGEEGVPNLETVSCIGGWGYILGDHGSGWRIGLDSIRLVLRLCEMRKNRSIHLEDEDANNSMSSFEKEICHRLGVDPERPLDLIAEIYRDRSVVVVQDRATLDVADPQSTPPDSDQSNFFKAEDLRKRWAAEATRVVFKYAFGEGKTKPGPFKPSLTSFSSSSLSSSSSSSKGDNDSAIAMKSTERIELIEGKSSGECSRTSTPPLMRTSDASKNLELMEEKDSEISKRLALGLLKKASKDCVSSIASIVGDGNVIKPNTSTLVLGGGLWSSEDFLNLVLEQWKRHDSLGSSPGTEAGLLNDLPEDDLAELLDCEERVGRSRTLPTRREGREFKNVKIVKNPAEDAAKFLMQKFLR
ncbi:hypothetical protein IE53DRAFT_83278 [Violaceomyces palustris]|uniref:Uncharacterized protein n=1 Tax=Violaceomyces palustris TaxID=1673888 RepID=A0ACD0NXY2_9BASI|nr:hypothetical protein IE53DRAFT_83278 [Violaceomyces palustris]